MNYGLLKDAEKIIDFIQLNPYIELHKIKITVLGSRQYIDNLNQINDILSDWRLTLIRDVFANTIL